MKRIEKKLALNKETIAVLKSAEMKDLQGGWNTIDFPCLMTPDFPCRITDTLCPPIC